MYIQSSYDSYNLYLVLSNIMFSLWFNCPLRGDSLIDTGVAVSCFLHCFLHVLANKLVTASLPFPGSALPLPR